MNEQNINKARALYYAMFSRFFVFTTHIKRYYELLELIKLLKQNPLDKTKIRRDEKKFTDHEDHIGFIFTVLSELLKEFYEHDSANIFKEVVVLLKAFIEFERIYKGQKTKMMRVAQFL